MPIPHEMNPNPAEMPLGTPAWRIALFYPAQGSWTESDYLNLSGGPLVEFEQGHIEVLDMPTKEHQRLAQFIFVMIRNFLLSQRIGEVFMAPLPMRLWEEKFREPDVLFVKHGRDELRTGAQRSYPDGADLVVEIVSEGDQNRRRDLEEKRADYARGKIPEYWILDPENETLLVLRLNGNQYDVAGKFRRGQFATSTELPDLEVSVDAWLNAARGDEATSH